jgi:retron-type reverse transcriptase
MDFGPGRSLHPALDALTHAVLRKKVNYVLDADVQAFFDRKDQSWMIKFMEHPRRDPLGMPLRPPAVGHPHFQASEA